MRFFFLAFMFMATALSGQTTRISAGLNTGFVMPHRPVLQYLVTDHIRGTELTFEKRLANPARSWHQAYHQPWWGIVFHSMNLGNDALLGRVYSITPFLSLPLSEKSRFSIRWGWGAGYLTRHYDRLENHKNIAIGSHVNTSVFLGLEYNQPLGRHLGARLGLQLQHYSNGAYQSPNLGVNIPMLSLSFYHLSGKLPAVDPLPAAEFKAGRARCFLQSAFGIKELLVSGNRKYSISGLAFTRIKRFSTRLSYHLFAEVFYNTALRPELAATDVVLHNRLDYGQAGLGTGIENNYGSLACYLQMGAYLYTPQKKDGRFYHRVGVKYYLSDKFFVSFGLKAHFAKADYLETTFALRL